MNQLAPLPSRLPSDAGPGRRRRRPRARPLSRILRRQHPQPAHAPRLQPGRGGVSGLVRDAGVPSIAAGAAAACGHLDRARRRASHAAPTVKQRLAAIRHLFDWLVTGQVVPLNPAASVRGPQHIVEGTARRRCSSRPRRGLCSTASTPSTPAGLARPGADRPHGLFVRAHRRGARHEGRGRVHAEPPPVGAAARKRRQGARHAVPP